MQFSLDRTGFPLAALDTLNLEMTLLPVTKHQFECFLTDPNEVFDTKEFGSGWYAELLAISPRTCPHNFSAASREGLFLTGIHRQETQRFAQWLGGFRLPTALEWHAVEMFLGETQIPITLLEEAIKDAPCEVRRIVTSLRRQLKSDKIADLTLMIGGVVEWVYSREGDFGLGQPRPNFYPNTYNPRERRSELWMPKSSKRLKYLGFRLVRQIIPVPEADA